MRRLMAFAAFAASMGVAASAQTSTDPARVFRDAVVQKQLYLRNFSAEDDVRVSWDGSLLRFTQPKILSLAAFITASAEVSPTRIRLHGNLQLVLHDADNPRHFLLDATRMPSTITIELRGTAGGADALALRDAVFFKDINEALRSVPAAARAFVPPLNTPRLKLKERSSCDCADTSSGCVGHTEEATSVGWKGPVATEGLEGVVLGSASDQRLKFVLQIDEGGKVQAVWILHYGEAEAVRAVAHSLASKPFTPASCHGVTTGSVLQLTADLHNY